MQADNILYLGAKVSFQYRSNRHGQTGHLILPLNSIFILYSHNNYELLLINGYRSNNDSINFINLFNNLNRYEINSLTSVLQNNHAHKYYNMHNENHRKNKLCPTHLNSKISNKYLIHNNENNS